MLLMKPVNNSYVTLHYFATIFDAIYYVNLYCTAYYTGQY